MSVHDLAVYQYMYITHTNQIVAFPPPARVLPVLVAQWLECLSVCRVKLSGVRQSKIIKGLVLASLGRKGLISIRSSETFS